jgi:hypothetical protein
VEATIVSSISVPASTLLFEIAANDFGPFAHPAQAPVTRTTRAIDNLRFHTFPIIANPQAQLALAIVDLEFDPTCLGMTGKQAKDGNKSEY